MPTRDDNIHIVERFVWRKITHNQDKLLIRLNEMFHVYQLHEDGSESDIPAMTSLIRAINEDKNAQFAIEVGHLPKNYTQSEK